VVREKKHSLDPLDTGEKNSSEHRISVVIVLLSGDLRVLIPKPYLSVKS
jgi:hypothetical protein